MKKVLTFVLALVMVFCCVSMVKPVFVADARVSPTAPTIKPPPTRPDGGEDQSGGHETVTDPTGPTTPPITVPGGGTTPGGTTPGGTTPGGTTPGTPGTKPSGGTVPGETLGTTPDGSTITGGVNPDKNPESPKTGDTSAEVFAFAGLVLCGAAVAVLTKKNKESDAQ